MLIIFHFRVNGRMLDYFDKKNVKMQLIHTMIKIYLYEHDILFLFYLFFLHIFTFCNKKYYSYKFMSFVVY